MVQGERDKGGRAEQSSSVPEEAAGRGEQERVKGTRELSAGKGGEPCYVPGSQSSSLKVPSSPHGRASVSRWQTVARDRCKDSGVPWQNPEKRDCCLKQNVLYSSEGFKKGFQCL